MALSRIWSIIVLFAISVAAINYFNGDRNVFNDMVTERKLKEGEQYPIVRYYLYNTTLSDSAVSRLGKFNWQPTYDLRNANYILTLEDHQARANLVTLINDCPTITFKSVIQRLEDSATVKANYHYLHADELNRVNKFGSLMVVNHDVTSSLVIPNGLTEIEFKSALQAHLNQIQIISASSVPMLLPKNMDGIFETGKFAVTLVLGLVGTLALFMGLLHIAEAAGGIRLISKLISPFLNKLFPELPKDHPSFGHMVMNFSANLLGLDNAATPFGLKAMQSLQELNPIKDRASNSQIMFLALHASGLTLIPVSIIAVRAANGSQNPNEIFIPLMLTTFVCTLTALLITCMKQRINMLQPKLLFPIFLISVLLATFIWFLRTLAPYAMQQFSDTFSNGAILLVFLVIVAGGMLKKINLFDAFVEGAKGGFDTAIRIIPYMVGMLVAVSMLRTSGAFELIIQPIKALIAYSGLDTQWAEGLPTALLRPFSAGGARGFMVDAMRTFGADSFVGKLVSVLQGGSETTFYVVALYFGAVSVKDTRYAIPVMLLADLAGIIFSIAICYYLFS
jgi:spore maturation protein SpmA/spore maturation protein SpmB